MELEFVVVWGLRLDDMRFVGGWFGLCEFCLIFGCCIGLNLGIYLNFVVIFRVAMLCFCKACDDGSSCHFERSEKSKEI